MKRVLILTDSLALPRKKPESTFLENTWPYLLKQHYDVYQFSKGGVLTGELLQQAHYYCNYNPDIIILQCGIVDCAPRAYSWREEMLFNSYKLMGLIRKILSKTITTRRLRRIRRKVWTSIDGYKKNIEGIINVFPTAKCFAVSILPSSDAYEDLVPGIKKNIDAYNGVLREIFRDNYIDTTEIPIDGIMSDYHHITKIGHEFVYKKIMEAIAC